MNQKKNAAKVKTVIFYVVIGILTVGIAVGASLPYILSRSGDVISAGEKAGDYPHNGDGVDKYGRQITDSEEMRGVWVAYLSLNGVNKSMIDDMVADAKSNGLNTIFLHVRPFGDALYKSDYYPWSHLVTGTQGEAPEDGFDPLAYAVEAAHREGIALHAWLNPLRIMLANGVYPPSLSDDNPYNVWRNDDNPDNDNWVIDYQKGKFYNPAVPEVRELIVNGTREIVERYDVDGVHWDDYFYPAYDASFNDSASYTAYTAEGGTLSLADWRRSNINELVKAVYSAVKEADSYCSFGISPAGNIDNCMSMGADVKTWGSSEGYVDYLIPQVYWTSDNTVAPFEPTCRKWNELVTSDSVRLYIGLALYKAGSNDDSGKWKKADDIIMNQVLFTRSGEIDAGGFVLYSYAYLDSEQTAEEMKNLRSVLS
ncbi:MAG: family 10 glycosylhydrolase [Clostridia bacterium]|nr:family 10 glycosylhydrolase [Clostridia bacterium]